CGSPKNRSEPQRQADRKPAGAVRPHAQARRNVGSLPVLTAHYRTDDRTQNRSGGHGDQVHQLAEVLLAARPAARAALRLDGDPADQCSHACAAEEPEGNAATAVPAARAATRADVELRAGRAGHVHGFPVLAPDDDGGAVDGLERANHLAAAARGSRITG